MAERPSIVTSGMEGLDAALKGGFQRPSNLLMVGAPLCGKRELGMQLLSLGLAHGDGAVYVSTSQTAEEARAAWLNYGLDPRWEGDGRVKFIDCYSKMLDVQSADTPSIRRVPSILDHTRLAVAVNEVCTGFTLNNIGIRMVIDSLSALLVYSSLQTVMRFLHIFLGQLRRQGVISFALLEDGAHDAETLNQLMAFSNGAMMISQPSGTMTLAGFQGKGAAPLRYEVTEKSVLLRVDKN